VRKIKGDEFIERLGTVDVVHGGFPCQDLSVAGKRAGLVCGGGVYKIGTLVRDAPHYLRIATSFCGW
jgi:DNA (cytosine-5)-methyltransferase 1